MIRVVVADDQSVIRAALTALLDEDPEVSVVGGAVDGLDAVRLAQSLRPDVIHSKARAGPSRRAMK